MIVNDTYTATPKHRTPVKDTTGPDYASMTECRPMPECPHCHPTRYARVAASHRADRP